MAGMALRTVTALVPTEPSMFELALVCEVFGIDRSEQGVPNFDFKVCAERPGPMTLPHGLSMEVPHGLEALDGVDLVVVCAAKHRDFPPALVDAVRRAHAAGAKILSVCTGVFVLGAAGLLDGRACTAHWMHTDELAAAYPEALVDPGVLFVDTGDVITSAGTAAGIDACLHLIRCELGAQVASAIARRMVVPPQRDGGQRQYVETPIPACTAESLEPVLVWMRDHLAEEQPVRALARRAAMSERTFARRFVAETGTTPARWLSLQRLHRARELLEASDLSVERVAEHAGFGSAALLRHHFTRQVGVPPADYRKAFSCRDELDRALPVERAAG